MTYHHLNREQTYTIALLSKQGSSLRSIARTIEVHVSTVSRELRRIVTSVVIAPSTHRCSLTSELLGGSILAASPALFRLVWPTCFSRSNGLPNRSPVIFA